VPRRWSPARCGGGLAVGDAGRWRRVGGGRRDGRDDDLAARLAEVHEMVFRAGGRPGREGERTPDMCGRPGVRRSSAVLLLTSMSLGVGHSPLDHSPRVGRRHRSRVRPARIRVASVLPVPPRAAIGWLLIRRAGRHRPHRACDAGRFPGSVQDRRIPFGAPGPRRGTPSTGRSGQSHREARSGWFEARQRSFHRPGVTLTHEPRHVAPVPDSVAIVYGRSWP
jgi:hypothetical protein